MYCNYRNPVFCGVKWRPKAYMGSFAKFKEIIADHTDFLLICHERPDGDSIGSMLALGEILESYGKRVCLVSKDPVPPVFAFLPGAHKIKNDFLIGNYETIILLDNGDFRRTGFSDRLSKVNPHSIHIVNIDHHPKNDVWKVAAVNYVDPNVSSTCELVYQLVSGLGLEISPSVATALLTGIFTDTGGFQHPNTSRDVLTISSELLNKGAKLRTISSNIANNHSVEMLKLWGIALSRLTLDAELGLAYSILTQQDIKNAGASEHEVSGLVNIINAIPESRVALLLYETSDGKVKGSLRTESEAVDVGRIAAMLNGGGHKKASGFSIQGRLEQVNDKWQIVK